MLLAVVAVGAGNDWIRTFGVPNRYQDAIRAIKEGHSFYRMSESFLTKRLTTVSTVIWLMWPVWGSMRW